MTNDDMIDLEALFEQANGDPVQVAAEIIAETEDRDASEIMAELEELDQ